MDQLCGLKQFMQDADVPFAENEPLKKYTSFKIGGPAKVLALPKNREQLEKLLAFCRAEKIKYYVLGLGSNILFADEGYNGLVICTRGMEEWISVKGNAITASCGVSLMKLCRTALENSLSGLEFAYGIPGSLGGALYMNAGAYGGEMKDVVEEVTFLDEEGKIRCLSADELALGYRTSIFEKEDWHILEARLCLKQGEPEVIRAKMEELMGKRKDKQPLEYPSAGSTFKRPAGAFAAALIEECGLKGYRVGDAAVSEKHSGFVVNLGNATCADVLQVADDVRKIVKEKTGYDLEKEIRVIV